jgi:hypothetical protein
MNSPDVRLEPRQDALIRSDRVGLFMVLMAFDSGIPLVYLVKELDSRCTGKLGVTTETMKHDFVVGLPELIQEVHSGYYDEGALTDICFRLKSEIARAVLEEFGLLREGECITALIHLYPQQLVRGDSVQDSKHIHETLGGFQVILIFDGDRSIARVPAADTEVESLSFVPISAVNYDSLRPVALATIQSLPTYIIELLVNQPDQFESFISMLAIAWSYQLLMVKISRDDQIAVKPNIQLADYRKFKQL